MAPPGIINHARPTAYPPSRSSVLLSVGRRLSLQIFVSHSHDDSELAASLVEYLIA